MSQQPVLLRRCSSRPIMSNTAYCSVNSKLSACVTQLLQKLSEFKTSISQKIIQDKLIEDPWILLVLIKGSFWINSSRILLVLIKGSFWINSSRILLVLIEDPSSLSTHRGSFPYIHSSRILSLFQLIEDPFSISTHWGSFISTHRGSFLYSNSSRILSLF